MIPARSAVMLVIRVKDLIRNKSELRPIKKEDMV